MTTTHLPDIARMLRERGLPPFYDMAVDTMRTPHTLNVQWASDGTPVAIVYEKPDERRRSLCALGRNPAYTGPHWTHRVVMDIETIVRHDRAARLCGDSQAWRQIDLAQSVGPHWRWVAQWAATDAPPRLLQVRRGKRGLEELRYLGTVAVSDYDAARWWWYPAKAMCALVLRWEALCRRTDPPGLAHRWEPLCRMAGP